MSERFETERCIKVLYKYSSFPFLFNHRTTDGLLLTYVMLEWTREVITTLYHDRHPL